MSNSTLLEISKKKLWNMQATVIPIVIGTLGTIPKGLLKGLEDLIKENKWRPSQDGLHLSRAAPKYF